MVNKRGIEINPEKVQVLVNMKSLKTVKGTQRLTRVVAALNRFISQAINKCLSLFKAIKKRKEIKSTEEWEKNILKSLRNIKKSLYLLVKPIQGECLFLYLAISKHTANFVLI